MPLSKPVFISGCEEHEPEEPEDDTPKEPEKPERKAPLVQPKSDSDDDDAPLVEPSRNNLRKKLAISSRFFFDDRRFQSLGRLWV